MNRFGVIARDHWSRWLPTRYRSIQDPEAYFSTLGQEIEERAQVLADALAGSDPPNESYVEKLGRLNMARQNAESQALRELALLEPETPEPQ